MTPQRTCIGCRTRVGPDTGLRVTRPGAGGLVVGRGAPGRGAWLCRLTAAACARAAAKRRAWSRALRAEVAPAEVDELVRVLEAADHGVGAGSLER